MRRAAPFCILVLTSGLAVLGCSSASGGAAVPAPAADSGVPSPSCPAGRRLDADARSCVPLVFEGDCPAGTMPQLGQAQCVPVGWHDCPAGFTPEPSGWGCREVLPAERCTGATREALGNTECLPLGDCAGVFPPPGTTIEVRASYKDTEVDARHVRSISAAVSAAPADAIIAVHEGEYNESLNLPRSVRIVGQCAAKVVLRGGTSVPGVSASGAKVRLSGFTIKQGLLGVSVKKGAFELEDTLLVGNLASAVDVYGATTTAKLTRTVVRDTTAPPNTLGSGILAQQGSQITVTDSEFARSVTAAVYVADKTSGAVVERSVLRDTRVDENQMGGYGVMALDGPTIEVRSSALLGNHRSGLMAFADSRVTVQDTVVVGTLQVGSNLSHGFAAFDGAKMDLSRVGVYGNYGVGLRFTQNVVATVSESNIHGQEPTSDGDFGNGVYVHVGSTAKLHKCAMTMNHRSGVEAFDKGTVLELTDSLVAFGQPSVGPKYGDQAGLGMYVAMGASASTAGTSFVNNHHTGIYLWESGEFSADRTLVRGTSLEVFQSRLGHGLLAQGIPRILITGSDFRNSAGVGLAFSDSTASVFGTYVARNAIGIHAQDGSTLREVDAPEDEIPAGDIVVGSDTQFEGNASRVGSAALPLPMPLKPAK